MARDDPSAQPPLGRLRLHLRLIDQAVAPVVARYREHIQCKKGCFACCSQTFAVSEIEAELLREGLDTLSPSVRDDIIDRARRHQPGAPCPVLADEGHCRLYTFRPRICRKYGIPLWDPQRPERVRTCSLNFRDVADLDPALIVEPQAEWAKDWIRLRRQLNLPRQENRSIAQWIGAAAGRNTSAASGQHHSDQDE